MSDFELCPSQTVSRFILTRSREVKYLGVAQSSGATGRLTPESTFNWLMNSKI